MSYGPERQPPDALLLLATGCAHCPVVLDALGRLVKEGTIGRLQVVNVGTHPDQAAALGARSVPWIRIGDFILEGLMSAEELRTWAEGVTTPDGNRQYFEYLLGAGRLSLAQQALASHPEWTADLLPLIEDIETPIRLRIGVGALLEEISGKPELAALIPALGHLSRHPDHRVRSDACHYLALTGNPAALPLLQECLDDSNPEVREIAADSITALRAAGSGPHPSRSPHHDA